MNEIVGWIFASIVIYGLIFSIKFFWNYPAWPPLKELAQKLKGKIRPSLLGGIVCKFKYESLNIKIFIPPTHGLASPRLILVLSGKHFLFNAFITRKEKTTNLLKKQLWGSYHKAIRSADSEFDDMFIIYTNDENKFKNYLSNPFIKQTIKDVVITGWENFYLTPQEVRLGRKIKSALGMPLSDDIRVDNIIITLEKIKKLIDYKKS
ncbi:MAG: hypothetical protein ABH858_04630 [Candidatus Omnitrophota bacterium]